MRIDPDKMVHYRSSSLFCTGIIQSSTAVAPLVNAPHLKPTSVMRHFSSFPMTAHLHSPTLRLVSLHPLLSVLLHFSRVPEIPDDFKYKLFISRTTTISSAIETIMEELGLAKTIPIPGAGNLEYVMEEVWIDGESQSAVVSCPWFVCILNRLQNRRDYRAQRCYTSC